MLRLFFLFLLFQLPQGDAGIVHRMGEIYPHPRDPEHLQKIFVDVLAVEQRTFLWWTRETPARGKISIQEERIKGGWWVSAVRELDIDGRWSGEVMLDPTLKKDNVVLIVLENENRQQIGKTEIHAGDLSKGVSGKVVVR